MRGWHRTGAIGLVALAAVAAAAADEGKGIRVALAVQAARSVTPDRAWARVVAQAEDARLEAAARRARRRAERAIAIARRTEGVEVSTEGYQTHDRREAGRRTGYRVRYVLRLEAPGAEILGRVLGELTAAGLRIEGVGFSLAPATRARVRRELVTEALRRLREESALVCRALGHERYRILRVDLGGAPPPVRPMMMEAAAERAAPLPLVPGTRRVEVRARGEVLVGADTGIPCRPEGASP